MPVHFLSGFISVSSGHLLPEYTSLLAIVYVHIFMCADRDVLVLHLRHIMMKVRI